MIHAKHILLILLLFLPSIFLAQAPEKHAKGEILVRFQNALAAQTFVLQKSHTYELQVQKTITDTYSICLFNFDESQRAATDVLQWLNRQEEVVYAQLNHWLDLRDTKPDDALYSEQWTLKTIDVQKVWKETTGGLTIHGDTIVVGVIDKGFDHLHEDLHDNLWINHAEIPDDGKDNDGNGYVDDYYGWNYRWNTDDHRQGPNNVLNIEHGTGVAGIIGAQGNNDRGIAGINWNTKLLLLTVIGYESEIIEAYLYMLALREKYNATNGAEGAFVVASSISLGIPHAQAADHPMWCEVYDLLGEAGILNVAATDNANYNVDVHGDMPTHCSSPYLLTVTNINRLEEKEPNAAWGAISIDLGAPGTPSFTTQLEDNYGYMTGTSAATPHVAASAALLYALPCEKLQQKMKQTPDEAVLLMKEMLLNSTKSLASLEDKTVSGGRLDIGEAMERVHLFCGEAEQPLKVSVQPNLIASSAALLTIFYDTPDRELYDLSVYSSDGKRLYQETIEPPLFAEKRMELQLPSLNAGLYIVALEGKSGRRTTTKLVVY